HRAAASTRGLPYFEFAQLQSVDEALYKKLPQALIRRKGMLPVMWEGQLYLVTSDPDDRTGIDAVRRMIAQPVLLAYAEEQVIRMANARLSSASAVAMLESATP